MTEAPNWLEVAKSLKEDGIAEPVLWLGDDRNYKKAKEAFGDSVESMLTFVHRPHQLEDINYKGEYGEFFLSEHYIRSKDICMKMMDRLDLYGTFSRIDREVYFHSIIIWTLKKFSKTKPDFLLMAEAPHSHAQYLIYEICSWLDIPSFKFNRWTLAPLIFLQNMKTDEIIFKGEKKFDSIQKDMMGLVMDYVDDVIENHDKYEISYMKVHRSKKKFPGNLKRIINEDIPEILKDIKHNVGNRLLKRWSSINPYELNIISRLRIQSKRAKNLYNHHAQYVEKGIMGRPYVYFALHYEHERSTNPDGGHFHDQFKALQFLRNILPESIDIIVKEHPSQFLVVGRGSRGRSPLFYKLIKNIKGIKIVDSNANSIKLLKNPIFVSTITGTIALEAAILGKLALTFGSTWFPGCPNTIPWSETLSYQSILNTRIKGVDEVRAYLKSHQTKHSVIGFQNGSVMRRFQHLNSDNFRKREKEGVLDLIKVMIKNV